MTLNRSIRAACLAISPLLTLTPRLAVAQDSSATMQPTTWESPALADATGQPSAIEQARQALARGELQLARLLAAKTLNDHPQSLPAIETFVAVDIARAAALQKNDAHREADAALKEAADAGNLFSATLLKSPQANAEQFTALVALDQRLTMAEAGLRRDLEQRAAEHIRRADALAVKAYNQFRANDRNKVREGLRELAYVQLRYELAGKGLRGEYIRSLDRLKGLISDKEWKSMQLSAGLELTPIEL